MRKVVKEEIVKCDKCNKPMKDAGSGIGYYCDNKKCKTTTDELIDMRVSWALYDFESSLDFVLKTANSYKNHREYIINRIHKKLKDLGL